MESSEIANLFQFLTTLALIVLVIRIVIFIILAVFLNKFHKLLYGRDTALVWIPILPFQTYFLGKLAFNPAVGWILVIAEILSSNMEIFGYKIPSIREEMETRLGMIIFLIEIVIFIYAVIKYFKIKKQLMGGNYGGATTMSPPPTIPNGPINQTDPFAVQNIPTVPNQMPIVPNQMPIVPNQGVMGQNVVQPNVAPTPVQAPQNPKFDPNITIDSIIHHASDAAPAAPIEQLDEGPIVPVNPAPVDTNNPNNM